MQDAQTESPSDSENAWGEEARINKQEKELPEALRVGPPGYTPRSSAELSRPSAASTNPYVKSQHNQGTSGEGQESSAAAWGGFGERPAQTVPAGMFSI